MSTRFAWLLGVVVLISFGLLVACGTKYSASSDGLVLVGSQGSNVIQTFSFNLGSGRPAPISNPPATSGSPSFMVMDPAGAYAYVIVGASIAPYKVNSNGTLTAAGTPVADPNPVAMAMDSAGKFLFVAEGLNSIPRPPTLTPCPGTTAQYGVCVYAIGSGASLTPVPGTFTFNLGLVSQPPNLVALATSPTVFPTLNAVCSTGGNPPTSEFLYVADHTNNVVWEFGVDPSSGTLQNPPGFSQVQSYPAQSQPSGVAVDPCDRFVYVSNLLSNNLNAYTICNASATQDPILCPKTPPGGDGRLVPVSGSPFSISGGANGPGPLLVDPFGNTVYVVDTLSSMISVFHISPVSGKLTAGNPAIVNTGANPTAIAIRSDDSWMFVSNYGSASLSQYSVTPATGGLSPQPAITTDNSPWGVAVK